MEDHHVVKVFCPAFQERVLVWNPTYLYVQEDPGHICANRGASCFHGVLPQYQENNSGVQDHGWQR